MNTELTYSHVSVPRVERLPQRWVPSPWNISITVSVNTVARRIYQALTVPEYQEAWFCMPGHDTHFLIAATQTTTGFRLDRFCLSGVDQHIEGTYLVMRRNKLHFSWRKCNVSNAPDSLVQIRLYGDFGRTTVRLSHIGLQSAEERRWHQEMWETSLAKLASLF